MCRVTFCGGSTRAGAITASVLNGIQILIYVILGIVNVIAIGQLESYNYNDHTVYANVNAFIIGLKVGTAFFFIGAVLIIIAMTCLIVSINKGTPGTALAWLVIIMIDLIFRGIQIFIALLATANFFFLLVLPVFAFGIYLWIVVLSFFHELRDNQRQTPQQYAAHPNPTQVVYPGQQMQYGQQPQQMQYGQQPQQMQYGQQPQPIVQYPQQLPFQQHTEGTTIVEEKPPVYNP